MTRQPPADSFASDSRAVAPLVGFILLFGLLVVVLAGYQAQVVPQQNADVEFQHFEENRNEMIQLRNAISTAGQSDVSQFPSVRLGTNYQTRTLTVNPPPPVGTLQTSDAYNITISDDNEGTDNVNISTRFLEYQPGYNELSVGSTWYENSVLYLDESESSRPVIIEEQNLITDGDTLKITALQNEFRQSGTGRVTLELYPTRSNEKQLDELEGELTVEIPTRLAEHYWNVLEDFSENSAVSYKGVDERNSTNLLMLEVNDRNNISINTVGIRSEPTEGTAQQNVGPSGGNGINGGSDSNGASGEFTQLDASVQTGSGNNNNKPSSVTIDVFEITTSSNIEFTAVENNGDQAEANDAGPSGGDVTLDLGGVGNNEFPVTVTADIDDGECLETVFENEGDTDKSLNNWQSCSN